MENLIDNIKYPNMKHYVIDDMEYLIIENKENDNSNILTDIKRDSYFDTILNSDYISIIINSNSLEFNYSDIKSILLNNNSNYFDTIIFIKVNNLNKSDHNTIMSIIERIALSNGYPLNNDDDVDVPEGEYNISIANIYYQIMNIISYETKYDFRKKCTPNSYYNNIDISPNNQPIENFDYIYDKYGNISDLPEGRYFSIRGNKDKLTYYNAIVEMENNKSFILKKGSVVNLITPKYMKEQSGLNGIFYKRDLHIEADMIVDRVVKCDIRGFKSISEVARYVASVNVSLSKQIFDISNGVNYSKMKNDDMAQVDKKSTPLF